MNAVVFVVHVANIPDVVVDAVSLLLFSGLVVGGGGGM